MGYSEGSRFLCALTVKGTVVATGISVKSPSGYTFHPATITGPIHQAELMECSIKPGGVPMFTPVKIAKVEQAESGLYYLS